MVIYYHLRPQIENGLSGLAKVYSQCTTFEVRSNFSPRTLQLWLNQLLFKQNAVFLKVFLKGY